MYLRITLQSFLFRKQQKGHIVRSSNQKPPKTTRAFFIVNADWLRASKIIRPAIRIGDLQLLGEPRVLTTALTRSRSSGSVGGFACKASTFCAFFDMTVSDETQMQGQDVVNPTEESTNDSDTYTKKVAFVYGFNVLVGVGALALPCGFQQSGVIPGLIALAVLGFFAFVTVTLIVESMSLANAYIKLTARSSRIDTEETTKVLETTDRPEALLSGKSDVDVDLKMFSPEVATKVADVPEDVYDITIRVELAKMAELFFSRIGLYIFYVIIILELFGDLSIYAVAVPKSFLKTFCPGATCGSLTPDAAYYLFLAGFIVCVGPFCFFNFQKTKYLQLMALGMRIFSFISMIVLAIIIASQNTISDTILFGSDPKKIPALFAIALYAFQCHTNLPSLVTPIRKKKGLLSLLAADFITVAFVFAVLCVTAVLAFSTPIDDLYTLNFVDKPDVPYVLGIIIGLLPVFTISSLFPLVAITLRNNLIVLFSGIPYYKARKLSPLKERILFTLIALIPAYVIAFIMRDVKVLVTITGTYPGTCIMFILPAFFSHLGRKKLSALDPGGRSRFRSPFYHTCWFYFLIVWAVCCAGVMTYNICVDF